MEQNAEYDDSITINPQIPLENQNLDKQTYIFLDQMLKKIDDGKKVVLSVPTENMESMKLEISKLRQIIEQNKIELEIIPEAKSLIEDYRKLITEKDERIGKLTEDNVKLRSYINNTPGWVRKFFMKDINHILDGK